ncbi:hypothetical protein [Dysgonomonas sp. HGC4]|uniref:hypothetical protein n=1 Tax=Dysgonomonas sp. HGC4 TaxID=1658009 RepID=UPI00068117E7|nr:hypothetical protein [Dysgonomonas sp. HGC4]MBD8349338.1 hypothetical protein [Dysgonomonas sp. HGC4]
MTNNKDREAYLRSWSQVMVNIWVEKLAAYKVFDTGSLVESVHASPIKHMGTFKEVIEHTFNEYGIFVERGTGREVSKGNSGDLGFHPDRVPRPWLNKKYYYYCMKLAEKMADMSGKDFTHVIQQVIEGTK